MHLSNKAILLSTLISACFVGRGEAQTLFTHGPAHGSVSDRNIRGELRTEATTSHRNHSAVPRFPASVPTTLDAPASVCSGHARAWNGQAMPSGEVGTLSPEAFSHSATINASGRLAFTARVDNAARNQGVFIADENGLGVIAMGCGASAGFGSTDTCGDPTPLGGTFGGFFTATTFATPDINDNGDVLFLADVVGGSATRGLFLHRESSQSIIKIAAIGDASPLGGTITMLGGGSMNNAGTIVFLANSNNSEGSDILIWQNGVVSKYVAAGDAAPGGGTFWGLGTELWGGYPDGTSMAGGPIPGINQDGVISFRGYVTGGSAAGGLFVSTLGEHSWMVKAGDQAPDGGGTYADFGAPLINGSGAIAFFASLANGPEAAWVAGKPGEWRRAIATGDQFDGGSVWSQAYSRNPMRAFADNGDLVLWMTRIMPDQSELGTTLISHADSSANILAVQSTLTPFGGYWGGSMDGWPTINNANQVRIGSATPGFALSTDAVLSPCVPAIDVIFRSGFDRE